ncbi:hypothetical protein F2P81_005349 [Scophthalmus maximus]|uniref:Contactin-associated protein-like 4 n=1 Tax=Scophthalmus maximus TaxID=52904 RepID=A0A6A4T683_SCOMX|nr:hypothetical protein F2P81_005349 [Scophthalmus maximus]
MRKPVDSIDTDDLVGTIRRHGNRSLVPTGLDVISEVLVKVRGKVPRSEACDGPLVSSLPPPSFRSSSQLSSSHGPVFAKVNRREGAGGWSPLVSDSYQWLEVDLERRTQITAVATQGRYGSSDWLTAYLLMFSDTGHNWRQHRQEDSLGAFPGNSNADTVVQYKLDQPVIARYLRLIPLDWNPTGRIGLRLEIYGCRYTSDVANFDGSSSLVFRLSIRPSRTATETIALKFKTMKNSGTLLHAEGQRDHSLSLVLEKGRLLLYHQQVSVAVTFTDPRSFLQLSGLTSWSSEVVAVALQFRTWNRAGLLLTFDLPRPESTVRLYLSEARLRLQIDRAGRATLELSAGSGLNDGQWHAVELISGPDCLSITVDKDEGATAHTSVPLPLTADIQLFFGGCPEQSGRGCTNPFHTFQGCMRLLTLDDRTVDLMKVQQRLLGNYSHLQMDICGIIDRCSPSHCEHGGRCSQSWSNFHCNCSTSGYRGATCHSSTYEQSCEAYKHKGNTSGHYYIDVDGSGPIRPRLIYCNMTEDRAWMVIQHNNTEVTRVHPSPEQHQHSAHFHYAPEEAQLAAIISQSEHCEQELSYRCRKSRLLNTPENFWNAAFFDKETSYLHFPTFNGELNADISFLFKTTSSSGVFLENLGIKDFIRIELSSSSAVVFSLDVGNGPLEVRVESSVPLNDSRWHSVRAERNVKEASLRVDQLPAATQEAPAEGHVHLRLNSQLFIGGTASRQKGFLGCIRSLQLNGVTLDLEERAKITPGVRPGCPGHCGSYGALCRNQGRCVERTSAFSCDCAQSAYTGAFCHEEVAASFKSTMSVAYILRPPHELSSNGSVPPPSVHSDTSPRGENVSLSFRTLQSPALLLYADSLDREYLALLINRHDGLELRYKLHSSRDVEVLASGVTSLADGRLHTVSIGRRADAVSVQIDQNAREDFNLSSDVEFSSIKSLVLGRVPGSYELDTELAELASLGFTGCLSAVRFDSVSPLKAALLHPDGDVVVVTGPLVQSSCGSSSPAKTHTAETTHSLSDQPGSADPGQPLVNAIRSDSALIGGLIAVVIFVTASALAIMARFVCSRKETYRSRDVKAAQPDDGGGQEFPASGRADSQVAPGDNRKEYFI